MEFTDDDIDIFLENSEQNVRGLFDTYQDLCLKYERIPMEWRNFVTAIMLVAKRYPSMREKAEYYRDIDIKKGIISEDDNLPPTLFYELHSAGAEAIFLTTSFVDDGIAIGLLEIPRSELESVVIQKTEEKKND